MRMPCRRGRAKAFSAQQVARLAGTVTGGIAAGSFGTMPGRAFVVFSALPPQWLFSAGAVFASDARRALTVVHALLATHARGRIAVERRAHIRSAELARTGAVAEKGTFDRSAVAHSGLAHDAGLVLSALPIAVAGAVEAAGAGRLGHALRSLAWWQPGRRRRADAERGRQPTRHTLFVTGGAATGAVDTEAAATLGGGATGFPDVFGRCARVGALARFHLHGVWSVGRTVGRSTRGIRFAPTGESRKENGDSQPTTHAQFAIQNTPPQ